MGKKPAKDPAPSGGCPRSSRCDLPAGHGGPCNPIKIPQRPRKHFPHGTPPSSLPNG